MRRILTAMRSLGGEVGQLGYTHIVNLDVLVAGGFDKNRLKSSETVMCAQELFHAPRTTPTRDRQSSVGMLHEGQRRRGLVCRRPWASPWS